MYGFKITGLDVVLFLAMFGGVPGVAIGMAIGWWIWA